MWELFRKRGSNSERRDRPSLYYPIYVSGASVRVPRMRWDDEARTWQILEEPRSGEKVIFPIDKNGTERTWRGQPANIIESPASYRAKDEGEVITIYYKFRPRSEGVLPLTIWIEAKYSATEHGTGFLKHYFTEYNVFSYPKSIFAVEDCLRVSGLMEEVGITLDFFAGSGTTAHAVMNLNREDGGDHKYILVEIGDYFDTVLKPRIQKVAFSANWKDGVPQDRDGVSHVFKYQRIESYEDALNNIRVRQPEGAQRRLLYEEFDDYRLHYMLDFETRDSPTLLTQEAFETPFAYTLKIQRGHESPQDTVVDLVETFHYLIGMHVQRLERHEHQGRPYVVSRGEVRSTRGVEKVVVVWRDTENLDLGQEADWANGEDGPLTEPVDRVYVNGPSHIDQAQPLEITFRERMEGGRRAA